MSAPGSTNLLKEEDGHRRGSLWTLIAIWARNCSCLDCCINWTQRTHRERTAELAKRWDGLSGFLIHESLRDILQDTAESDWTVFGTFLLDENVCCILWAWRLKMDAPTVQKNFGWLFRQRDVSVISRVWISCLLRKYYILLESLMELKNE